MSYNKQELIEYLRSIGNSEIVPTFVGVGICDYVGDLFGGEALYDAQKHFRSFEYFSGDMRFPVTHPGMIPHTAYRYLKNLYVGEYGRRRKLLCLHIANKLEKEL
jgi:hypothetical protein